MVSINNKCCKRSSLNKYISYGTILKFAPFYILLLQYHKQLILISLPYILSFLLILSFILLYLLQLLHQYIISLINKIYQHLIIINKILLYFQFMKSQLFQNHYKLTDSHLNYQKLNSNIFNPYNIPTSDSKLSSLGTKQLQDQVRKFKDSALFYKNKYNFEKQQKELLQEKLKKCQTEKSEILKLYNDLLAYIQQKQMKQYINEGHQRFISVLDDAVKTQDEIESFENRMQKEVGKKNRNRKSELGYELREQRSENDLKRNSYKDLSYTKQLKNSGSQNDLILKYILKKKNSIRSSWTNQNMEENQQKNIQNNLSNKPVQINNHIQYQTTTDQTPSTPKSKLKKLQTLKQLNHLQSLDPNSTPKNKNLDRPNPQIKNLNFNRITTDNMLGSQQKRKSYFDKKKQNL